MKILSFSCFYHDSAAALVIDGELIAAVQEERFSRIKNDDSFPLESIKFCLKHAGLSIDDLDAVVYYEKPFLKFERLLKTYLITAPFGLRSFIRAMSKWLGQKLFIKSTIRKNLKLISEDFDEKKLNLKFPEHHFSHAAGTYFMSGFKEAAIVTLDGVGEFATCSIMHGEHARITNLKELHFPHSIGLLYTSFTYFLGFEVNKGEYKMMGLAPYGNPEKASEIESIIRSKLVKIHSDGSIFLNLKFFNYRSGLTMIKDGKWHDLFGIKRRTTDEKISQNHCDIALAIQNVTEDIILKMVHHASELTKSKHLCLSGGVALNCVANGKIIKTDIFKNVFVQPAAGDAGGAVGAALGYYYTLNPKQIHKRVDSVFIGPEYNNDYIRACLKQNDIKFEFIENTEQLIKFTAQQLVQNKIIGWFRGRMEFGPRALGNRSILGNPLDPKNQSVINLKIKFRESFRPFAPIVLEEQASEYFDLNCPSPFMALVAKPNSKYLLEIPPGFNTLKWNEKLDVKLSEFPAVTHVDLTSRIQTVNSNQNPDMYYLISEFKKISGYGMLINTSFNIMNEPIVNTPQEAIDCFNKTGMDILIIGNYILKK